jgi:hypothetical protein
LFKCPCQQLNTCEAGLQQCDPCVRPQTAMALGSWVLGFCCLLACRRGACLGRSWEYRRVGHGSTAVGQWIHDGQRRLGGVESVMRGVRCAFLVLPEKGRAATTHECTMIVCRMRLLYSSVMRVVGQLSAYLIST